MGVVAVLALQRKRLLSLFKKFDAVNVQNAVTVQEIIEKWGIGGIEPLRSKVIEKSIRVLISRGKIQKTDNGKYYLTTQ